MFEGTKSVKEKENSIQEFTVQFSSDWASIDGTVLPLGQISTDILNLPDETLHQLQEKLSVLFEMIQQKLFHPDIKKDLALVSAVQDKLNEVLDLIFILPLYKYLDLDKPKAQNMLLIAYQDYPSEFSKMVTMGTEENYLMVNFFQKMSIIFDEIISFQSYVGNLLDFYFEKLKKRNSEHYAVAVYDFFNTPELLNKIANSLPPRPAFLFQQSRSTMIEYTTMPNPENKKQYLIAERMVFHTIGAFLHVDFFRGLMAGNAPRRCHHCHNYFLLTDGYNICYCNNIAPGETERTCRRIGAHKKEASKDNKSPIQVEYNKVYNRLKTRKSRGKISVDEWNKAVAKAQDLKEQSELGKISEFDLKRLFEKM